MKKPVPFGKYQLLERINVGGMAEVFKAKSTGVEGFEKLVAIKRILPNIAEAEDFITMFVDEAKIAVQLNHAAIAQTFELGKQDDALFIAMEYVHGLDMRAVFERLRGKNETLPIAATAYVLGLVCEALDYAHRRTDAHGRPLGIVHRDVSPQNVIVSFEGDVKVIDFGIAKAANKASRTQAGILKGKFGYMSPEQVRGLPLDRRSDVFALGTVLWELLTGQRLFVAESDFATLEKVRKADIQPPSVHNPRVPPELDRIALRALEREPDRRWQWASEMGLALQRFQLSTGELFARADLARFMKRTFAQEWGGGGPVTRVPPGELDDRAELAIHAAPARATSDGGPRGGGAALDGSAGALPELPSLPGAGGPFVGAAAAPASPVALPATPLPPSAPPALPPLPGAPPAERGGPPPLRGVAGGAVPPALPMARGAPEGGPPPLPALGGGPAPSYAPGPVEAGASAAAPPPLRRRKGRVAAPLGPPPLRGREGGGAAPATLDEEVPLLDEASLELLPHEPPELPPVASAPMAPPLARGGPPRDDGPTHPRPTALPDPNERTVAKPFPSAPATLGADDHTHAGLMPSAGSEQASTVTARGAVLAQAAVAAAPRAARRGRATDRRGPRRNAGLDDPDAALDGTGVRARLPHWALPAASLAALVLAAGALVWNIVNTPLEPADLPRAVLTIMTRPDGAIIELDGTPLGVRTPATVELAPGAHRVRLRKEGFLVLEERLDVPVPADAASRKPVVYEGKLVEEESTASLRVTSTPSGARILVNGEHRGETPSTVTGLKTEQTHLVVVAAVDYDPWQRTVTLRRGETLAVDAELKPLDAKLIINSRPAGARVYIDGERRDNTPTQISGFKSNVSVLVRLEKPGYRPWEERITFAGKPELPITVGLMRGPGGEERPRERNSRTKRTKRTREAPSRPAPDDAPPARPAPREAAPTGEPGALRINSKPLAEVWLNGRNTGHLTPLLKLPVPAGAHRVTLKHARTGCEESVDVVVAPGEVKTISRELRCANAP